MNTKRIRLMGVMVVGALTLACRCPTRPVEMVDGEDKASEYHFRGRDRSAVEALGRRAREEQRPVVAVALSGGAQNGAFGAGILCNWQNRPTHVDLWTGISTGSLLITFAFLIGPDVRFAAADVEAEKRRYRVLLEEAYSTYTEADLMSRRSLLKLPVSSALASMGGLRRIIAKYVTDEAIDRVAEAALDTDVLVAGTTDMDTGEFIAWDLKRLARDKRHDLYRKVVFASCLEPVAMDPEYIGGHMHADGGVRHQIFAPILASELLRVMGTESMRMRSSSLRADGAAGAAAPQTLLEVYLLVNGRLGSQQVELGTCLLDVALRAVDLLALESKLGNLLRIQTQVDELAMLVTGNARSEQFRMVLAAIDPDFSGSPKSHFDPDYMRALFAYGKGRVAAGTAWVPFRMSGRDVIYLR